MSKTLRLDDDAIQRCVGICNTMIGQMDQAIKNADQLKYVSGFGGFDSAKQLQARYNAKFNGGEGSGSVRARLREFRDVIITMRDTFAAGGEAFSETDSAIGQALSGIRTGADQ
ncbi:MULTISPECIES: hypothetical protein [unclassified Rhodococcus (in: high G+C Gram-positive bacteria)]|uniref:hypothetical protein n=1 Tax=unclassified Rhodococcus (in: high G+C Gram-positive bacteria) TaxID=192944 RepID=UPI00289A375B|nr:MULTISPECIES: hypothetical protein [unclassified Rhodococcus (in: high G+C Gram-positive bacteria)]